MIALSQGRQLLDCLADACCEARNSYISDERGGPDPDEHWATIIVRELPELSLSCGWRSIETAPEGENILLATTGEHVGEATMESHDDELVWFWKGGLILHPNHKPIAWQPLPEPPK